jgi:hypothetical protein
VSFSCIGCLFGARAELGCICALLIKSPSSWTEPESAVTAARFLLVDSIEERFLQIPEFGFAETEIAELNREIGVGVELGATLRLSNGLNDLPAMEAAQA